MKNVLKMMLLWGMLAVVFTACKDDDPVEPDPPATTNGEAKFTSLGFYVEDNPALDKDYIIRELPEEGEEGEPGDIKTSINLPAPLSVNLSSIKARFTTTEDDIVKVGSAVVQSEVTALNFNYPIDFIVSNEISGKSTRYTVKFEQFNTMKWKKVTVFDGVTNGIAGSDYSMALNPVTKKPNIFFQHLDATGKKASVIAWNGTSFDYVGASRFTAGAVTHPALKFHSDGTPYVFYRDGGNSNKPTVMKYSSSTWSTVGDAGYSDAINNSYSPDMAVFDAGKVMTFYTNNGDGSAVKKREANYSFYNSGWTTAKFPFQSALESTKYIYTVMRTCVTGDPLTGQTVYFATGVNGTGYAIYKYAANTWTTLLHPYLMMNGTEVNVRDMTVAVNSEGQVHLAFGDNSEDNSRHRIRVIKYNGTNWVSVGSSIDVHLTNSRVFCLAFDKNDVPFLAYRGYHSATDTPMYVVSLDDDTRDWTPPIKVGTDMIDNSRVFLQFDADGVGYLSFAVAKKPDDTTYYEYHVYQTNGWDVE